MKQVSELINSSKTNQISLTQIAFIATAYGNSRLGEGRSQENTVQMTSHLSDMAHACGTSEDGVTRGSPT